jgi:hypothetical protein
MVRMMGRRMRWRRMRMRMRMEFRGSSFRDIDDSFIRIRKER